MNKFFILLKKEIRELLTLQIVIPFLAMMVMFFMMGKVIGNEVKKQDGETTIAILDEDQSQTTKSFIEVIDESNFNIDYYSNIAVEDAISQIKTKDEKTLIVFPSSFEEGILANKTQEVKIYTVFSTLSIFSNRDVERANQIPVMLNEILSSQLVKTKAPDADQNFIRYPINANNFVVLEEHSSNINPSYLMSYLYTQTMFVPVILFLIITLSSQLVAGTIASEKENKTLETLLSTPLDRKLIVAAKLLAAGTVSLAMAGIYLIGLQSYTTGIVGQSFQVEQGTQMKQSLIDLDLTLGAGDYVILGLSLFVGILIALSMAFIIGSFAKDTKSSQALMTPLMILLLIPYLLTMLVDINKLVLPLKIIVYAIPFTHTFTTVSNLLLQRYDRLFYGLIYVVALIIICIYFASKIFTSEKILTLKLSFGKKKQPAQ